MDVCVVSQSAEVKIARMSDITIIVRESRVGWLTFAQTHTHTHVCAHTSNMGNIPMDNGSRLAERYDEFKTPANIGTMNPEAVVRTVRNKLYEPRLAGLVQSYDGEVDVTPVVRMLAKEPVQVVAQTYPQLARLPPQPVLAYLVPKVEALPEQNRLDSLKRQRTALDAVRIFLLAIRDSVDTSNLPSAERTSIRLRGFVDAEHALRRVVSLRHMTNKFPAEHKECKVAQMGNLHQAVATMIQIAADLKTDISPRVVTASTWMNFTDNERKWFDRETLQSSLPLSDVYENIYALLQEHASVANMLAICQEVSRLQLLRRAATG